MVSWGQGTFVWNKNISCPFRAKHLIKPIFIKPFNTMSRGTSLGAPYDAPCLGTAEAIGRFLVCIWELARMVGVSSYDLIPTSVPRVSSFVWNVYICTEGKLRDFTHNLACA